MCEDELIAPADENLLAPMTTSEATFETSSAMPPPAVGDLQDIERVLAMIGGDIEKAADFLEQQAVAVRIWLGSERRRKDR